MADQDEHPTSFPSTNPTANDVTKHKDKISKSDAEMTDGSGRKTSTEGGTTEAEDKKMSITEETSESEDRKKSIGEEVTESDDIRKSIAEATEVETTNKSSTEEVAKSKVRKKSSEEPVKLEDRKKSMDAEIISENKEGSRESIDEGKSSTKDERRASAEWSSKARKFSMKSNSLEDLDDVADMKTTLNMPADQDHPHPQRMSLAENEQASKEHKKSRGSISKRQKSLEELGPDEDEKDNFGQAELNAAKQVDDDVRQRRGSWANEDDDVEGEKQDAEDQEIEAESYEIDMQGLLGRSELAKEDLAARELIKMQELKKRRKRKQHSGKEKKKDKDKKSKKQIEDGMETKKPRDVQEKEKVWVEPKYDSEDFISKPTRSEHCDIAENILKFYHSFGYDCLRRNNLQMLDANTIVFINGNYLHFYDVTEKELKGLRRSAIGCGLGHVAVHPEKKYFAVGEKGHNPCIIIYTWPDKELYRILRRGTTRGYAFLNFSSSGDLLCSQGMDPDYMLTIWDWKVEKIVLRYKAFAQDIFQASFSINPGELISCGMGHIRFWRMAETFTGLKLQGAIGRFGKTEISDIQGFACLSDGKVISGSEWGNMLIWEGGLIVAEIIQPSGKPCHNAEVAAMYMQATPELLTIGLDGYIKLWESDSLDIADTVVGDSGKFELEPMHELRLSGSAKPICGIKSLIEGQNVYLIQDTWGKIWGVNLTKSLESPQYRPDTVMHCPGGGINAIATSTKFTIMVVGTTEGHLWLIEYITKECLCRIKYVSAVVKLIWLSTKYDPNGLTFLAGFGDGHLRTYMVNKKVKKKGRQDDEQDEEKTLPFEFFLVQILRVHKGSILVMKLDEDNDLLYCCGEDRLIFTFTVFWDEETQSVGLYPLGYVTAPFPVASLDLHPFKDYRLIIAGKSGQVAECRRPEWGEIDTSTSYNQGKLQGRRWWYRSVKSGQRQLERRAKRKIELEDKLNELKADIRHRKETGKSADEEGEITRLNDIYRRAQQQDDDEPLYFPEKPCPVLTVYYHINKAIAESAAAKSFFIHCGGYDAGYIYECKCTRPDVGGFHPIPCTPPFADDIAVHSYTISKDNKFLIFGMGDGSIRVMPQHDPKKISKVKNVVIVPEEADSKDEGEEEEADSEPQPVGKKGPGQNSKVNPKEKKKIIPPFLSSVYPYDLHNFETLSMHDPDRGAVNDLAWSHDSSFLFSVGADGSIFACRFDPTGKLKVATDDLSPPMLPKDPTSGDPMKDEESSHALTLEELKKKEEDDRIFNLTEEKKQVIRKKLRAMRQQYRSIKLRNQSIPEKFRLPKEVFKLDRRIYEPYREKIQAEVEDTYRTFEYEGAKSMLMVEKIEKNYFNEIKTPHIIVKDISHTIQVHTLRHRHLTKEFLDLQDLNKVLMVEEEAKLNEYTEEVNVEKHEPLEPIQRITAQELIGDYVGKKYDVGTIQAIRNLEKRLDKRYNRQCRWQALMKEKIKEGYQAPEDVEALKEAKASTGDYKLKTSTDYIGENITMSTRRQRCIDLKLEMYGKITEFNVLVYGLRDEKRSVITACRKVEEELKKIRKLLPKELRKPIPPIFDMESCEEPEKLREITPELIAENQRKSLMASGLWEKKDKIEDTMKGTVKPIEWSTRKSRSKLGSKKRNTNEPDKKPDIPTPKPKIQQQTKVNPLRANRSEELEDESMSTHKYRKTVFNPKTLIANKRYDIIIKQRCFQQDTLLKQLNKIIFYYRERVRCIRDDRTLIQLDLKLMSLRLMNMIAELQIVKEFDSSEKAVLERLRAQRVECNAAKDRLEKAKKKLTRAKFDFQKSEEGIHAVQKEASHMIGDKHKFADYLWRVYRKKVRVEVIAEDEEEGLETVHPMVIRELGSSISSSEGSSGSTSQDSGSDLFKMPKQRLDPNICPDNLDRELYNRICDLRERKARLEIDLEVQKKVVDKIQRDCEEVEKVYKKFEGRLSDIGQEITVIQRHKQRRMNDLMSLVVLKADQIQCLDEDALERAKGNYVQRIRKTFPRQNELLVFPMDGVSKLERRAEELKQEAAVEKKRHRSTVHMLLRLREELKKVENIVTAMGVQVQKEMKLKFGKMVDLDVLSASIISVELLDTRIRVQHERNTQYLERGKIIRQEEEEKARLTKVTKENSEFNTVMAMMIERKRDVDYFLYKQQKINGVKKPGDDASISFATISATDSHINPNEDLEIDLTRTENYIRKQQERIQLLRDNIAACKRKNGLPPIIPLENVNVGNMFMQAVDLKDKYNKQVEIIFKSGNASNLRSSDSIVPSFDTMYFWNNTTLDELAQMDEEWVMESIQDQRKKEVEAEEVVEEKFEGDLDLNRKGSFGSRHYPMNILPDDQMSVDERKVVDSGEDGYTEDPIPVTHAADESEEEWEEELPPATVEPEIQDLKEPEQDKVVELEEEVPSAEDDEMDELLDQVDDADLLALYEEEDDDSDGEGEEL